MHKDHMDDQLLEFQNAVNKWVAKEIAPNNEEWRQNGSVPKEIYQNAGEQGFLCMTQSEKYGGLELDLRYSMILNEELAKVNCSGAVFYLHSDIIAPYIEDYGSEVLKQKYLPKAATGENVLAIAMTEPGTRSDLRGITTRAKLEGDKWVINGSKTFISNGICSDSVVVVARTDKSGSEKAQFSLFVVESDTPGYTKNRCLKKIGLKSQDTAELSFENCKIPKENIIGKEGQGLKYLMQKLGKKRLCIAMWCVASARFSLNTTIKYCKGRQAFGKTIFDFQNTKHKLAGLDTEITIGETFVDRCIQDVINKTEISISGSKAKLWCSEMLGRVTDECLQLHGGYGYMDEYEIAHAYTDARVQRIFGRTSEIMKELISREL